ncbi:MAG: sigma-70 family RNA polymerase sigma factor [Planctomycetota bacterium]
MQAPETRLSLIIRLRNPRDAAAWESFVDLYGNLIRQVALKLGVDADEAADIAQETLLSVSRAIDRFEPREGEFAFRGWLAKIARNQTLQTLRRRRRPAVPLNSLSAGPSASGDSIPASLEPSESDPLEAIFETEHRRQLFRIASTNVRKRTGEVNWKAFWMTFIDEVSSEQTASTLGMRVAQVYVARSRVLAAIRKEVELLSESAI